MGAAGRPGAGGSAYEPYREMVEAADQLWRRDSLDAVLARADLARIDDLLADPRMQA